MLEELEEELCLPISLNKEENTIDDIVSITIISTFYGNNKINTHTPEQKKTHRKHKAIMRRYRNVDKKYGTDSAG